jgi:hypothetical protein
MVVPVRFGVLRPGTRGTLSDAAVFISPDIGRAQGGDNKDRPKANWSVRVPYPSRLTSAIDQFLDHGLIPPMKRS